MATPLPVSIGRVALGGGRPAVCVPLVARTPDALVAAASALDGDTAELVELRIDFVDAAFAAAPDPDGPARTGAESPGPADLALVAEVVRRVRDALDADLPLLFTLRTHPEGGERDVAPATYDAVLRAAMATGLIDAVDVEMYTDPDLLGGLVDAAHEAGLVVVMSSHDFSGTPSQGEIVSRLLEQQENGADVVKFAAMPVGTDDVLTLMRATAEFRAGAGLVPAVTMSMGPLGVVSRLAGETFGSCLTFGSSGASSAPGQVPAAGLRAALELVHEAQQG
ncbi:type I 3-dehydroquinate dehydratase [Frigoribacterium sp. VKM Ac-2836]|uniref:type I 3-dehydroquinate dehydratase n=1 Tax=Frigoribacterium sp. VKM Ac-2836 TaxID=2739014 RepID=UPI001565DAE0|nr:type I 3-dehydroquinate dehydratase [Frigoribacterium sp. VKM Ac-2836]NRD27309.1 type I 3-dehydroquinate dehydratase [Frigoribacterium sp. VKM Ac-2836]